MLLLLPLLLASCAYRLGEPGGNIAGNYRVGNIDNDTAYRQLDSELRSALIEVLRRQKGVSLSGMEDERATLIGGRLVAMDKIDRELGPGEVLKEAQLVISFTLELRPAGKGGTTTRSIKNTTVKNSSGTYRTDRGGGEAAARAEALRDLAEAAVASLGGNW